MGKLDRRHMKAIQKKALKDVRQKERANRSSVKKSKDKMVMAVHDQMDGLLKTDAFIYEGLEKRNRSRVPKIRKISHKIK